MKPSKYLGWTIWPIADLTTGKVIQFDIMYPGEWIYPHATYPTMEEARTAIRQEHRTDLRQFAIN